MCSLIRKGLKCIEHDLPNNSALEHLAVEVVTGRKQKQSIFIFNNYSNLKQHQQRFRTFIHKVEQLAEDNTVLLCGDFNVPHTAWGYSKATAKGCSLLEETTEAGCQLLNDPSVPMRHGTSVQRDTNPDMAFSKSADLRWRNPGETLGSDHFILEITIPLRGRTPRDRNRLAQIQRSPY